MRSIVVGGGGGVKWEEAVVAGCGGWWWEEGVDGEVGGLGRTRQARTSAGTPSQGRRHCAESFWKLSRSLGADYAGKLCGHRSSSRWGEHLNAATTSGP